MAFGTMGWRKTRLGLVMFTWVSKMYQMDKVQKYINANIQFFNSSNPPIPSLRPTLVHVLLFHGQLFQMHFIHFQVILGCFCVNVCPGFWIID